MKTIEIYTDGSKRKDIGGWAYLLTVDNKIVFSASDKIEVNIPIQYIEAQAIIEALSVVYHFLSPDEVRVYTDCKSLTYAGKKKENLSIERFKRLLQAR